jgi:hypothetical protein
MFGGWPLWLLGAPDDTSDPCRDDDYPPGVHDASFSAGSVLEHDRDKPTLPRRDTSGLTAQGLRSGYTKARGRPGRPHWAP